MNGFLSVKNFETHQHYKDRRPPWIKLHAAVLDDYAFSCLQDASKSHLMLIWLLASKLDNRIPNDAAWIGRQIGATTPVDLQVLITAGFLLVVQDASGQISPRVQGAMPETEGETEAVPSVHPAIETFLQELPEDQNAEKWRAITQDWQTGLGVEGGKPATVEDVAIGLTEYMVKDGRDFSPVHVRSFVERARRARLKSAARPNGQSTETAAQLWGIIKPNGFHHMATTQERLSAADSLAERGVIKSAKNFLTLFDKCDRKTLLKAETDAFAIRHITERLNGSAGTAL